MLLAEIKKAGDRLHVVFRIGYSGNPQAFMSALKIWKTDF